MDKPRQNRKRVLAFCLILAAFSFCQAGCLLITAGAAGGAAAGYAYYRGKVCQAYCADFEDAWAAVHTALNELGMPILSEERHGAEGWIKSQTAEADRIRIKLEVIPSKIPADGPLTQVSVRVGTFGDHPVSERVLYQVGAHLVPGPVPTSQPVVYPAPIPPSTAPQTTEPPLNSLPPADGLKPTTAPLLPLQPQPASGK